MSETKVVDLRVGDHVCDMHYGLRVPDGYRCLSSINLPIEDASRGIEEYVAENTEGFVYQALYINKVLVVAAIREDIYTCLYSYDNRRFGIVILRKE